ncbi:Lipoprotein [Pseudodesulfovibrio profundus]|uniref:Lipoprotein n=1 Tax=Pseudodesulfovibrio profundus TaxID=57320 RepID=A0A2C8F4Z0_9BACT|nr:diheme cytochrome c [Pseudodesulfovibrio profundus]SOB57574.1 Lipoprotein [Pseudodesulfovibrio profundus]
MNILRNRIMWWVSLLLLLVVFAPEISADDDNKGHQRRERKRGENNHSIDSHLKPVSNATYAEQCGACHFAYQPELLPAGSWKQILDGTDDHFGEAVDLDEGARLEISGYLASNAADKSSAKLAKKIMSCLGGMTPLRITDIPCIRKEHHEITPQTVQRKSVGSLSNCIACHRTGENGVYDDENVSIPK